MKFFSSKQSLKRLFRHFAAKRLRQKLSDKLQYILRGKRPVLHLCRRLLVHAKRSQCIAQTLPLFPVQHWRPALFLRRLFRRFRQLLYRHAGRLFLRRSVFRLHRLSRRLRGSRILRLSSGRLRRLRRLRAFSIFGRRLHYIAGLGRLRPLLRLYADRSVRPCAFLRKNIDNRLIKSKRTLPLPAVYQLRKRLRELIRNGMSTGKNLVVRVPVQLKLFDICLCHWQSQPCHLYDGCGIISGKVHEQPAHIQNRLLVYGHSLLHHLCHHLYVFGCLRQSRRRQGAQDGRGVCRIGIERGEGHKRTAVSLDLEAHQLPQRHIHALIDFGADGKILCQFDLHGIALPAHHSSLKRLSRFQSAHLVLQMPDPLPFSHGIRHLYGVLGSHPLIFFF